MDRDRLRLPAVPRHAGHEDAAGQHRVTRQDAAGDDAPTLVLALNLVARQFQAWQYECCEVRTAFVRWSQAGFRRDAAYEHYRAALVREEYACAVYRDLLERDALAARHRHDDRPAARPPRPHRRDTHAGASHG